MKEKRTIRIVARYDRDTKRTHRFLLEPAEGIVGSIYINKDIQPLPKEIEIDLKMKGDE